MAIRFSNTTEDFMAASELYHKQSPTNQRQIASYRWGGASIILALGLIGTLALQPDSASSILALGGLLGAGIFAYRAPSEWMKSVRHRTALLYKEGVNKALFSEKEIDVTPDGITSRSAYGESKTAWGAIERIEATSEYTLIYIGSVMAFVIPNKRIPESDLREFLTALKIHYKPDHTLPQPVPVVRPTIEPERQQVIVGNSVSNEVQPATTRPWYIG